MAGQHPQTGNERNNDLLVFRLQGEGWTPETLAEAGVAAATDLAAHLADTGDAHDASAISILDAGSDFTATTVEGALDELQADNEAHVAAADPHTGYRLESADHTHASTGLQAGTIDHGVITGLADDDHPQYLKETDFDDIDFLVGTATGHTGAEIVVGTAPAGELGGTWASPTVDATHSGSTHAATQAAAEATAASAAATHAAAADPHTGYVKENDANWTDLTDGGATTLHTHAGGGGFTSVVQQIIAASGDYTPTAGMDYCIVEMVGGGGGGGGADSDATEMQIGAGGGSGEYARGVFTAAAIGASKAITIGAVGSAGTNAGGDGGTGGTTSMTTLLTAVGGVGGGGSGSDMGNPQVERGGLGGTGGTGTGLHVPGSPGLNAVTSASGSLLVPWMSGTGGSSYFGGGGRGVGAEGAGENGLGYGSGGGGAADNDTSGSAGGTGALGVVIITEFVS